MPSSQDISVWPGLDDYDKALKTAITTVSDPDIKNTKPLGGDKLIVRLNGKSSKYVSVYKMVGVCNWAVKCFFTNYISPDRIVHPPSDIRKRYQQIYDYVQIHAKQLTFLVPFTWVENGIMIDKRTWPFIKSPFVDHETLGSFLQEKYADTSFSASWHNVIMALSKQWLHIISVFESLNMAHGDLDLSNVIIFGAFPDVRLRLVDFDSMYVPTLDLHQLHEDGHEHFQPVQKGVRSFNHEMDRFSALIIYLSLITLADNPRLWDSCKANERTKLLLGAQDFRDLRNSHAYQLLRRMQHNQDLQRCLDELMHSTLQGHMPRSLNDVLHGPPLPVVNNHIIIDGSIALPLEFISEPKLSSSTQSPAAPTFLESVPLPVDFISSVPESSKPVPAVQNGKKTNPLVWWSLVAGVVAGLIAAGASAPVWWFIAAMLLIIAGLAALNPIDDKSSSK